jgi:hypothetical protein
MLLGVVLRGFFNVMLGLKMVPVRNMRVMSGLFGLARFVMLRCLLVMVGGVFAMFRRVPVMFSSDLRVSHVSPHYLR